VLLGRIGRADDLKFGMMVLEMLPLLQKRTQQFHLILMSAPASVQRWIARHKLSSIVTILPETSDPYQLSLVLASIDIMTHSSLIGESFGCSLAEALYHARPVVVDSTPWVDNAQIELVDNAVTGYVVDNASGYASAVHRLIAYPDLRRQYGRAGRVKMERYCLLPAITAQVHQLYHALIHGAEWPASAVIPTSYVDRLSHIFEPHPISARWYEYRMRFRKKILIARRFHQ
jgi:glycosyltransferase involved in cell wall biosynthesis